MNKTLAYVNSLLASVFDNISLLEENFIKNSPFKDISMKESKTIEVIGLFGSKSMSCIAKRLNITVGTLTISINNLQKKGYVIKSKSEKDKRVIKVMLTKKGQKFFKLHQEYKEKIMQDVILQLSKQETEIFNGALNRLSKALKEKAEILSFF